MTHAMLKYSASVRDFRPATLRFLSHRDLRSHTWTVSPSRSRSDEPARSRIRGSRGWRLQSQCGSFGRKRHSDDRRVAHRPSGTWRFRGSRAEGAASPCSAALQVLGGRARRRPQRSGSPGYPRPSRAGRNSFVGSGPCPTPTADAPGVGWPRSRTALAMPGQFGGCRCGSYGR